MSTPELRRFTLEFPSGARTLCAIGADALRALPALRAEAGLVGKSAVVADAKLFGLYGPLLQEVASGIGPLLARPLGEDRKQLPEVEAICESLANAGVLRDGHLCAVGGGVLTDLAGFAAAIYLRGIGWAACPTTLLAQVDAGLGGKTGANLRAGKNLIGAFHQPRLVLCDTALLRTLPLRELWSGLAEVVKTALLAPTQDAGGMPLLERCERDLDAAAHGDAEVLAALVDASMRVKGAYVQADEREGEGTGPLRRAYLNLGHTVGHAIERACGYGHFTHGEAVALGLRGTLFLSRERGLLSDAEHARALKLVSRLQVSPQARLGPNERLTALDALSRDKKARAGKVRFVLLRALGQCELLEVDASESARALDAALSA